MKRKALTTLGLHRPCGVTLWTVQSQNEFLILFFFGPNILHNSPQFPSAVTVCPMVSFKLSQRREEEECYERVGGGQEHD